MNDSQQQTTKAAFIPVQYEIMKTLLALPNGVEVAGFGIDPAMNCLLVYVRGEGLPDRFVAQEGQLSQMWENYQIRYVDPDLVMVSHQDLIEAQQDSPNIQLPLDWEEFASER